MANLQPFKPNSPLSTPSLSNDKLDVALELLYNRVPADIRLNRRCIDPPLLNQKYALMSFIPCPDAVPDKNGFYGFVKNRGSFTTIEEADEQAKHIIQNVDSTNSIFTCNVGRPVPLVVQGYAESLNEIDLQSKAQDVISKNVKKMRLKEQKQIEDMKEREDALRKDIEGSNTQDEYVSKRVKRANLMFTVDEHQKLLAACEKELVEMFKKNPNYELTYMEMYMDSRKKAHLVDDAELPGFMKYMDTPLPSSTVIDEPST